MALGAVLLSFPLAIMGAYLISTLLGLNVGLGIIAYGALGAVALTAIMLVFAARRS